MAQIQTNTVVITFSKLVRSGTEETTSVTDEILRSLEAVAQELVGDSVVVECELT